MALSNIFNCFAGSVWRRLLHQAGKGSVKTRLPRTLSQTRRRRNPARHGRDQKRDDLVYKALANRDRRAILDQVRDTPKTTGDLCRHLSRLDRCTVMLHLRVLEKAGLVISQRKGRHRLNYLDVAPIQLIYHRWIKNYAQPAAELLTQLKHQLESQ